MPTSDTIQAFIQKYQLKVIESHDPSIRFFHPFRGTKTRLSPDQPPFSNPGSLVLEDGFIVSLNACGKNWKDADVEALWRNQDCTKLEAINLAENEITKVHFPDRLTSLSYINLCENSSLNELVFDTPLPELEVLDISNCALEQLNLPQGFEQLQTLDLHKNNLSSLTFEADCPSLEHLFLSENELIHLHLPAGFHQLKHLYLNQNKIKEVIFDSDLPELRVLDLEKNKLKQLPKAFLFRFQKLESLYLYENAMTDIPIEVISGGERDNALENIRNYLESLQSSTKSIFDTAHYLHQAKMILVGNGEVGKTSIRRKLLDKKAPLPKKNERTEGLDIVPYIVKDIPASVTGLEKEIDFQLNIWDFGGQGRYREVQQLFCSRKSLYVFVTAYDDQPKKEDYVGFEYWLNMVSAYSFNETRAMASPVIHVVNKCDLEQLDIQQKTRRSLFPNIHKFVAISCKDPMIRFEELEEAIRTALPNISNSVFSFQVASNWLNVKKELEALVKQRRTQLSLTEYYDICKKDGLDQSHADTWLEILDRIGSLIYFGDYPDLKDWIILDPIWVKDSIYKVLNSEFAEGGILQSRFFKYIWPDVSEEEYQKIVALMQKYKLCYARKDHEDMVEYVVPALLPIEKPKRMNSYAHLATPDYQFRLVYAPFIPAGTVNKLIVLLEEKWMSVMENEELVQGNERRSSFHGTFQVVVYNNLRWRNNVVIHAPQDETYAHMKEVWHDKAVFVDMYGKHGKALYEFVLEALRRLNQELKEKKYLQNLIIEPEAWFNGKWRKMSDLEEFGVELFHEEQQLEAAENPKQLLAQGRLKEALEVLALSVSSEHESTIINLQFRLSQLTQEIDKDVINAGDARQERNKIVEAIWNLLNGG